jgi:ligand-binding SRPBCC domain-containing protein
MPTYTREIRVDAPFEDVWAFHSQVSGLEALTPGFMNLEVKAVTGPDGEANPEILEPGSRIDMSMRPGGVLPQQTWTSIITERQERTDSAFFCDEMEGGPFPEWVHTHSFFTDNGATIIHDQVEYSLPFVGGALGRLGNLVGFEPMFRFRHRKTRELLEG